MHANRIYGKAFGQMRADGLHDFTNPRANLSHCLRMLFGHLCSDRHDDLHAVSGHEKRLRPSVKKAFVGWTQASKVFHQRVGVSDIMGTRSEQWEVR